VVRGNGQLVFAPRQHVRVILKSWQVAGLQGAEEFTNTEASQLLSIVKRKEIQITLLKTAM